MDKPSIFLGSSGKQESLLQTLERGLDGVANVVAWTGAFNPGATTLERLVELTKQVDFAAFIFAQDDWTARAQTGEAGQAAPRDNVVFEAGLFGGVLGMRRTFILHEKDAKLPSDLLGLTCVRYTGALTPTERKAICQKLRKAIETEIAAPRIEGAWWQFSLTERSAKEPSALSLLHVARVDGALEIKGRSWGEDGRLTARYWSEASKQVEGGLFYYWRGERPLDPNAPRLEGVGEIKLETADRAAGYFTTRADNDPHLNARTVGVYWRADPGDVAVMEGRDDKQRIALIAERLTQWNAVRNG